MFEIGIPGWKAKNSATGAKLGPENARTSGNPPTRPVTTSATPSLSRSVVETLTPTFCPGYANRTAEPPVAVSTVITAPNEFSPITRSARPSPFRSPAATEMPAVYPTPSGRLVSISCWLAPE